MNFTKPLIILTAIFLVISFVSAAPASKIPGIAITSPVSGDRYSSGCKITVSFCVDCSITYIDEINLNKFAPGNKVAILATGINLNEGKQCYSFDYTLPTGLNPEPRYLIGIGSNYLALSGSFSIGNPGFGLIVTKPNVLQNKKCGGKLTVKWIDPYNLYQDLTLNVFLNGYPSLIAFSQNVLVSKGEVTATIPTGLQNNKAYNAVIVVDRLNNDLGGEFYVSNTFTVNGC
ncbi:4565_t:CDS:2 [Diversispora eburnea]|uniref:4565_t:CDS:1 n=1 Tax=Diversispora eburnea TaxID=1213867 RepID=A0A9N9BXS8_9GLOM|nr:4565_t:CDS:2 [Diversispora eburnea]